MTVEQLRVFHRATPFKPFEIYLADGRILDVNHPEGLAMTPSGRTISVAMPDDTLQIVDLLLVTSLKPLPNGGKKTRRRGM